VDLTGRLDLGSLSYEPEERGNFNLWVKVHDKVNAGEMPPREMPRPNPAKTASFVKGMEKTLTDSESALMAGEGRSIQRRMNKYEYENAIRDLLHLPMAQIMNKLPEDGEAFGFNKSGQALDVSYLQMQRFMIAADYAMKMAMSEALNKPEPVTRKLYARDEATLRSWTPRENGTLPDRLDFPVLDSHAQPDVRAGRAPATSPETREREAVGKVSSIFSDAGTYSWSGFRAPASGHYQLKVAGYSVWVGGGGIGRWFYEGQGNEKAPVYYLPLWHRPNLDEVWPGRRGEPMAAYASASGSVRQIGLFDFTPEPSVSQLDVSLMAGEVIQTDAARFFKTRVNGTDEQYVNPLAQKDGMPGYAIQWIEVTGPIYDENYGAGYKLLFGDLPMKRLDAPAGLAGVSLPAPPAAGGGRGGAPGARGGFARGGAAASRDLLVEVESANPAEDAQRLLRGFLHQAYRRPVEDADVNLFLALYSDQFSKGFGFAKSMLAAYTAILSSPKYVFIQESPGRLDDWALATRLSLFLWNSVPDETLRALAASGELHKPQVLRAQTQRMLKDPKSQQFVTAFTDYWLDLRKIDDNSPSTTLYNDYELDDPLKLAALDETRMFFAELLNADLPARNIIDSNFTFLNERLAEHYAIPSVTGSAMRKVTLPPDSLRGGLLTQASILKVTANGTTTSPVLRGHWITERILGIETSPPPPSVKAVEPDIRGAVTIRQQLEKHRADPTCASCHTAMDPPGFALESFDVMGGFRTRYRAVSEDIPAEKGWGLNGQAYAFHYALPVDAAGQTPDGKPFTDVKELKKLLLRDEDAVAQNLVKQLSIYATGSPVRFSDRQEIAGIMERAKSKQYGVRSIVEEIVQSDLFQSK
ncbi:MAG TPA: DUF1592 domain-containing protein, partial [Phycisphaerae bacterium]